LAALSLLCLSAALAAEEQSKQAPPKPPPYTGLKKRIAVMPIVTSGASVTRRTTSGEDVVTDSIVWNAEADPGQIGAALTEQLTTALINTGRFIVLERKALDEVLGEQDLGASGRVNQETAAAKGRVIGAEWLVKAAITEYTDKKSRSGGGIAIGGVALGGAKREAFVAMDVRIVDAATGEVIDSLKADGRAKSSGAIGGLSLGGVVLAGGKEDTTPIGQATRAALTNAIDFICQRMEQLPWQSRVMEVDGKEITVTGGKNMNIKAGDTFDVYRRGKALVDPETGQTLGYRETRLGPMKITEVMEKFSVGTMLDGTLPQRGDVVRCPPAAAAH
jgi:curli biogenesis system outer membrane secretion channel CsgG